MGHLINPIQFRLGNTVFPERNWPALNKEQYMFCYGIQKDFTDYFRTIFLFKKKLVLKRRHRKRKFYTQNRNPRLLFSHCNINFFGFNLKRVLVDVNIYDLHFESKWENLFNTKRFQNFIYNFSQIYRTANILRSPSFFINLTKETLKKFFAILNIQYNRVTGTLLSQTSKWVKAYLSKIYQKFFSFFNDAAYLINKRKLLRKARRLIKKGSAKDHIFITSRYKFSQKRKFAKNWSKIFLLLSPISAKNPLKIFKAKNKKKISKLKKFLLIKNKYVFNFSDIFNVYFKLLAQKFAKKVRRRDLKRFYSVVEEAKVFDYLKSIKNDLKVSLRRLSFNKPILSLIPVEDKIRLYKSQAHYHLKNVVLKKQFSSVDQYIKLPPAFDLDKRLMKNFYKFKKDLALIEHKVNTQFITKKPYNRVSKFVGLQTFIKNIGTLLEITDIYNIQLHSLIFKESQLLYPILPFKKNSNNDSYINFFKQIIAEFTIYRNQKNLMNKNLLNFIKQNAYIIQYTYKTIKTKKNIQSKTFFNKKVNPYKSNLKKTDNEMYKKNDDRNNNKFHTKDNNYYFKKYPRPTYTLLSNFNLKLFNYKNILANWALYEGNFWIERLINNIIRDRVELMKNTHSKINKKISCFAIYKFKESQYTYFKNELYLYNNMSNFNFPVIHKELIQTLDYSDKREKFLKGSVLPSPKYANKQQAIEVPIFDTEPLYKHYESPTLLSNIDPFFSEQRTRINYHYTLDPFFQKYMKLKNLKSLLLNIAIDLGNPKMITAKFLSFWLKSLFRKGKKLTYVLKTLDRFVRPNSHYIKAVSVLFVGRFTRSAYTTNKYYKFGALNHGEILKTMDYDAIEFSTKFGMCGIKVKVQYKVNVFAQRNLITNLKTTFYESQAETYKLDKNLHLPLLIKHSSKRLFRIHSNLKYKNNIPFYQFK